MGIMKSLDLFLTEHKLSDAQKNAVVELLSGGFTTAKLNTIKSLEKRGLVSQFENGEYIFDEQFRAGLKEAYSVPEVREVKGLAASQGIVLTDQEAFEVYQESVESLLQGDPWELGDAITADEAYIVLDSDGELKDAEGTEFNKFDSKWNDLFKETAGFGATLDWRGVEVWDGLTAAEIKEDMETAAPINRKARRTHFRTLRNAFRRANVERPRKALKLTGAKGL